MLQAGKASMVPVLLGSNKNEGSTFITRPPRNLEQFVEFFNVTFGKRHNDRDDCRKVVWLTFVALHLVCFGRGVYFQEIRRAAPSHTSTCPLLLRATMVFTTQANMPSATSISGAQ